MNDILNLLKQGNKRALARAISMVENETSGYSELLKELSFEKSTPIIGITGPPGAGKSTLVSALTSHFISHGNKVAIIAIDPSSPFNHGSLMGDRVRMSAHFLHPDVFIRSMASRGSLGGLAPKIYEVADVMKAAGFDYIFIETVGVGQSEVEIAALADTTILTLVPEAGDEIQTIKSGVMEIADIYVVNKGDREGADSFMKNLQMLAHSNSRDNWEAPVIKTVATKEEGISQIYDSILHHSKQEIDRSKKIQLLAEKAMMLIKNDRTRDLSFTSIYNELRELSNQKNFNLYQYVYRYSKT